MRQVFRTFRVVAFLSVLVWAYFVALYFRSWDAGLSPHTTLLVAVMFAGPFAALVLIGLPWRRHLALVAALLFVATVAAETVATSEEAWFVAQNKHLPPTAEIVFHDRWWPNGNSFLYFDPATGELGGGD
jgi:hypothetical protein